MASEATPRAGLERVRAFFHSLQIETHARVQFKDITSLVEKLVRESGATSGMCFIYVPHTTAALLINENDDPALQKDLDHFLKQLAPCEGAYHHNDGNCDAHLKASLIGCSKSVPIEGGRLLCGRWQGIFFCEFDGPRRRELKVKIVPD